MTVFRLSQVEAFLKKVNVCVDDVKACEMQAPDSFWFGNVDGEFAEQMIKRRKLIIFPRVACATLFPADSVK